mmetsp:Transcript_27894/g.47246  ORF Transcript_27894/g.47246 Transcript_27894/m.47246 type:complete len:327 (-) Transcript_27894:794-1774(-)
MALFGGADERCLDHLQLAGSSLLGGETGRPLDRGLCGGGDVDDDVGVLHGGLRHVRHDDGPLDLKAGAEELQNVGRVRIELVDVVLEAEAGLRRDGVLPRPGQAQRLVLLPQLEHLRSQRRAAQGLDVDREVLVRQGVGHLEAALHEAVHCDVLVRDLHGDAGLLPAPVVLDGRHFVRPRQHVAELEAGGLGQGLVVLARPPHGAQLHREAGGARRVHAAHRPPHLHQRLREHEVQDGGGAHRHLMLRRVEHEAVLLVGAVHLYADGVLAWGHAEAELALCIRHRLLLPSAVRCQFDGALCAEHTVNHDAATYCIGLHGHRREALH